MIERIVHVKKDAYDAYVGRRMPDMPACAFTQFGNPFRLAKDSERGSTLTDYLGYLLANPQVVEAARRELAHANTLACWCAPAGGVSVDDALICHAQVLARSMRGDYDEMTL